MKIKKMVLSPSLRRGLSGMFTHLRTDGCPYLIGGIARMALSAALGRGSVAWESVNDRDFTVIGGSYIYKDRSPRKARRVEVEYDAPHKTLDEFFASRDLSINQVAIDRYGNVWFTALAEQSYRQSRIVAVQREWTPRLLARALRFRNELNMRLEKPLYKAVLSHIEDLKNDPVYMRYIRQGLRMNL